MEQNSAAGSPMDPAGAPMTVGKWKKNVRPTAPKAKANRATNSPAMTQIQSNGRKSNSDSLTVMEFSWDGASDVKLERVISYMNETRGRGPTWEFLSCRRM